MPYNQGASACESSSDHQVVVQLNKKRQNVDNFLRLADRLDSSLLELSIIFILSEVHLAII